MPTQGEQQPPPVFPRRFSSLEVKAVGLRQLQLTKLAHHPESIGVVEHLLEGPERFAVVTHLNQPQRLWVQPETDQPLCRQPCPGRIMLSDPEQRRRFIAAGLITLLFLPTTNQQARTERRGQAVIPFRARRQHFLQAVVGKPPL